MLRAEARFQALLRRLGLYAIAVKALRVAYGFGSPGRGSSSSFSYSS